MSEAEQEQQNEAVKSAIGGAERDWQALSSEDRAQKIEAAKEIVDEMAAQVPKKLSGEQGVMNLTEGEVKSATTYFSEGGAMAEGSNARNNFTEKAARASEWVRAVTKVVAGDKESEVDEEMVVHALIEQAVMNNAIPAGKEKSEGHANTLRLVGAVFAQAGRKETDEDFDPTKLTSQLIKFTQGVAKGDLYGEMEGVTVASELRPEGLVDLTQQKMTPKVEERLRKTEEEKAKKKPLAEPADLSGLEQSRKGIEAAQTRTEAYGARIKGGQEATEKILAKRAEERTAAGTEAGKSVHGGLGRRFEEERGTWEERQVEKAKQEALRKLAEQEVPDWAKLSETPGIPQVNAEQSQEEERRLAMPTMEALKRIREGLGLKAEEMDELIQRAGEVHQQIQREKGKQFKGMTEKILRSMAVEEAGESVEQPETPQDLSAAEKRKKINGSKDKLLNIKDRHKKVFDAARDNAAMSAKDKAIKLLEKEAERRGKNTETVKARMQKLDEEEVVATARAMITLRNQQMGIPPADEYLKDQGIKHGLLNQMTEGTQQDLAALAELAEKSLAEQGESNEHHPDRMSPALSIATRAMIEAQQHSQPGAAV